MHPLPLRPRPRQRSHVSTYAATLHRARLLLQTRPPADLLRIASLDAAAAELADTTDPQRAYAVALRIIDLAQRERLQAAHLVIVQQRQRQARAAGQARAALAQGIDVPAVRAWAKSQGIDCPARGRYLPADVVQAYQEAHP